MLIVGDSSSFSNGDLGNAVEIADSLDFLVVQDTFLSCMSQVADVVLPSMTFAEKEGTFTNLERRVQPLRKVLDVKNTDARPDWWITCEIAKAMNADGFDYHCPAQILDEISGLVPFYAGITYQRLTSKENVLEPVLVPSFPLPSQLHPSSGGSNVGIQWPCLTAEDEGSAVLYTDGFPNLKARLLPLEMREAPNMATPDFPLVFLPGRVLHQPQAGMEIIVSGNKNYIERDEVLAIHPSDAAAMDIVDNDSVELIASNERIRAKARVTPDVFKGTVSATFLFGDLMTRLEASDDPDPMSSVPRLDVIPVRLVKTTLGDS